MPCARPVRTAAPLPRLRVVHDDAHRAVAELAQHVAGAVGAAVVDDDDLAVEPSGSSTARMRRTISTTRVALVETGTIDRELAELRRRRVTLGHGRAPPGTSRACARDLRGARSSAPSRAARARGVMSGRRCVGIVDRAAARTRAPSVEPVTSSTSSASSSIVNSSGLPMFTGLDDVGVEQREEPAHLVVDVAERAGLLAVAVDRERLRRRSPARGSSRRPGRRPAAGAGRTC